MNLMESVKGKFNGKIFIAVLMIFILVNKHNWSNCFFVINFEKSGDQYYSEKIIKVIFVISKSIILKVNKKINIYIPSEKKKIVI